MVLRHDSLNAASILPAAFDDRGRRVIPTGTRGTYLKRVWVVTLAE